MGRGCLSPRIVSKTANSREYVIYLDVTYLVAREYQGICQDDVLSSASSKDNDFGNVIRSERFAITKLEH